jgi:BON domain
MPWNSELRSDVEEQLAWEPDIDADAIAVIVVDGHVTLRGTVGSVEERRTAERIAARASAWLQSRIGSRCDASTLRGAKTQSSELRSCEH